MVENDKKVPKRKKHICRQIIRDLELDSIKVLVGIVVDATAISLFVYIVVIVHTLFSYNP